MNLKMQVAFGRQDLRTDWRTIRVLDVDTGTMRVDTVQWARFTDISAAGATLPAPVNATDGSGALDEP